MDIVDCIVVGAGQAGLAMSACLRMRGIDHVVLERGGIAHKWGTERWDSFTLLSPNWQTRLPGHHFRGPDPNGFMTGSEVVAFLRRYGADAPVRTGVDVLAASPDDGGWRLRTTLGEMWCRTLVVATGDLDRPRLPEISSELPPEVTQVHTSRYRNPAQLPPGGVLVVGAGPSGQQIAAELADAGRSVHLATGRHQMMPRRYRGQDAYWWMDRLGMLARTVDTLPSPADRFAPNAVLAGGTRDLDLPRLIGSGVRPHGRLIGIERDRLLFAPSLQSTFEEAAAAADRFRRAVDDYIRRNGVDASPARSGRRTGRRIIDAGAVLDLRQHDVTSVIWATGFTAGHRWLPAAAHHQTGEPQHVRGVGAMHGLYFLGLKWMHRRSSHTIDGVGRDAEYVVDHLSAKLHSMEPVAA